MSTPDTEPRGLRGVAGEVQQFNDRVPVGSPVVYWPGVREGAGTESVTRTRAWLLGDHTPVVMVEDYPGGIALTHVMPLPAAAETEREDATHEPAPDADGLRDGLRPERAGVPRQLLNPVPARGADAPNRRGGLVDAGSGRGDLAGASDVAAAEPQPEPTPERQWPDCTCPMNGPYLVGVADDCPRHRDAPELVQDDRALGRLIWETSRADESTISATGAKHVARTILLSDWLARYRAEVAATELEQAADAIEPGDHSCFKSWCPRCAMRSQRESTQRMLRDRASRLRATGRA